MDDGPAEWQRVDVEIVDDQRVEPFDDQARKVDFVRPVDELVPRPLEQIDVTGFKIGEQSIDFDVDQIGQPVLVRASYFPNWDASGAQGPYRVTPNLMVVVPTDTHVELHYGWTPVDLIAWLLTLLGIGGVVLLARRPDLDVPAPPVPSSSTAPVEPLPVLLTVEALTLMP